MKRLGIDSDLADIEWRQATSIAWPTLAVIAVAQALTSELPTKSWQFIFVGVLSSSLGISYWLNSRFGWNLAFLPVYFTLLLYPIVVGSLPTKPWVSLGLVVLFGCIYISNSNNLFGSLAFVTCSSLFMVYVASKNYRSFSDNRDLSLLHGYFGFIWTFTLGIASIFIRRKYESVATQVEDKIDTELDKSFEALKKKIAGTQTEKTYLRLHGTILNTLIYFRNSPKKEENYENFKEILKKEYSELIADSEQSSDSVTLVSKIEYLLENRVLSRMNIEVNEINVENVKAYYQDTTIEILREIILNFEKHSLTTFAEINLSQISTRLLRLSVKTDTITQHPESLPEEVTQRIFESRTLNRILVATNSNLKSEIDIESKKQLVVVEIPIEQEALILESTLSKIRLFGLNDFVDNYLRVGALIGLFSLPGYFAVGLHFWSGIGLTLVTILFPLALYFRSNRFLRLFLGTGSTVLLPVIAGFGSTCQAASVLPWIFNLLLMVSYFFLVNEVNAIFKWIPLTIFSIESIVVPLNLPYECHEILYGSIPGIPIIIVLGLTILRVRQRQFQSDRFPSLNFQLDFDRIRIIEDIKNNYFKKLCDDIQSFIENEHESSLIERVHLDILINRIQCFLICSPYLPNILIERLYEIIIQHFNKGLTCKLITLGNIDSVNLSTLEVDGVIENIQKALASGCSILTLLITSDFEIIFEFNDSTGFSINPLPIGAKIRYSILNSSQLYI